MTAHILYTYYLNAQGTEMTIGGVQTYITNLVELFNDLGWQVIIYQQADSDFHLSFGKVNVIGVKGRCDRGNVIGQRLFDRCKVNANPSADIILFGTDTINVPCPGFKSISIQHGIYWDIPRQTSLKAGVFFKGFITKAYKAWKEVNRVSFVDTLVCVDYNFINWYRALVPFSQARMKAIMNFTVIPSSYTIQKPQNVINIIFARRLVPYRGTRIFAEAILRVLKQYEGVHVTIAGNGPDERWLKDIFNETSNVEFISYSSEESLKIHANKHIAIVPTVGSEGTSLSLLEAMACGCAVICTNVGGMTNIVQNGYNGIMIDPTVESLYDALVKLLNDSALRDYIGKNGRDMVIKSFSKERWREEWSKLIEEVKSA